MQRLWIAIGNTAEDYRVVTGIPDGAQPWQRLKRFRNDLAHRRLPDIDDDWVWRTSTLRASPLRDLVERLLPRAVTSSDRFPPAAAAGASDSPDTVQTRQAGLWAAARTDETAGG